MESENLQKEKQDRFPGLLTTEMTSPIKRCPQCEGVFVTDEECESCGFQLRKDKIGSPFGNKSLYEIRDRYWQEIGPFVLRFPFLERKKSDSCVKYKRRLLLRYNTLLDYFYNNKNYDYDERRLFLIEFKDLLLELIQYDVSEDLIWYRASEMDPETGKHSLYDQIALVLKEARRGQQKKLPLWERILGYKVLGILRFGNLFLALAIIGILVLSSLAYYHYALASFR